MNFKLGYRAYFLLSLVLAFAAIPVQAQNYLGYRWASTQNPFVVQLGTNVNKDWKPLVDKAATNWSKAEQLDVATAAGATSPFVCAMTMGRVEVCNAKYGLTGWYGYTSFSTTDGFINGAIVKLNDSYRMTKEYKTMIACHEIGHTLGLAHQDTDFYNQNIGTCLDFTTNPSGNQQPNSMDYQTLNDVYTSTTSFSTVSALAPVQLAMIEFKSPRKWGKIIHMSPDQSEIVFAKELGNRHVIFTHVNRVPGELLADEMQFPQP